MNIALLSTATELSTAVPHGCFTVPDLEDMIAASVREGEDFCPHFKGPQDSIPIVNALRTALDRRMRKAERVVVDELTIFVLEDVPAARAFDVFMYCPERPREWAVGIRYRTDVDWWLVVKAGKYLDQFFLGLPITALLHTIEINHWLNASHFFSELIWTYVVRAYGTKRSKVEDRLPAEQIFPFLQRLLKTEHLVPLYQALKNVNFYQVIDAGLDEDGQPIANAEYSQDFSLAINTSPRAWTEVERMMTSVYPAFFLSGGAKHASQIWEGLKSDPRSVLLLARSIHPVDDDPNSEPMILGFLAGGMHPISDNPHIMAVGVLADERRRGIGRALVRRFFSHTAYKEVTCHLHIKLKEEPYEQAAFLTSLNGMLKTKFDNFWVFEIVNPFLK